MHIWDVQSKMPDSVSYDRTDGFRIVRLTTERITFSKIQDRLAISDYIGQTKLQQLTSIGSFNSYINTQKFKAPICSLLKRVSSFV